MRKKILFIIGSINQTSQMHQISLQMPGYDCWFSQIFADSPIINMVIDYTPFLDKTALSGQFKKNSENYCLEHGLQVDYKAKKNRYDLVVYCADMIIPDRMLQTKTLWVQEGMIDELTLMSKIVKKLHLPPYFAVGTSLNGASNICDVYCAASEGYKQYFTSVGTDEKRLFVTGIPNFDNCQRFLDNNFPHKNFVLVATSDIRECFKQEDRPAFIKNCAHIAAGRQLIFKLHPNEIVDRAVAEIKEHAPQNTLIYTSGNTNEMIANCDELITQFSTVVYVGIALGKKVHSFFDVDELERLVPIQNGGTSAKNIAQICKDFVEFEGKKEHFAPNYILNIQTEESLVVA